MVKGSRMSIFTVVLATLTLLLSGNNSVIAASELPMVGQMLCKGRGVAIYVSILENQTVICRNGLCDSPIASETDTAALAEGVPQVYSTSQSPQEHIIFTNTNGVFFAQSSSSAKIKLTCEIGGIYYPAN